MRDGAGYRRWSHGAAVGAVLLVCAAVVADEPAFEQQAFLPRPILQLPAEPVAAMEMQAANLQPVAPPAGETLDSGAIAAGQAAFARSCTSCHDEQRSLQKSKSYAGWLATVRRMASKEGADISSADVAPIAAYLASVAGTGAAARAASDGGGDGGGGWSFATTVSTLHRSASDAYPLENP